MLAKVVFVCGLVMTCQVVGQDLLNSFQDPAIPGIPAVDYPIFSQVPLTSFTCDNQVEGYYADPEADCQAFHICASDGHSGLTKYSFLCPNGTIFKQQAMEYIIEHIK